MRITLQYAAAARARTAPATYANRSRNASAARHRHGRWQPARAAAWQTVKPLLPPGARVAVVGAGNGDTLPLDALADHADQLTLIDLDPTALRAARHRIPRRHRGRVSTIVCDVTDGAADQIVLDATLGRLRRSPVITEAPLPGAPYDLVIGDLVYSQLLYPALIDLNVPPGSRERTLGRHGPALARATVSRMHVSAPDGYVVHINDPVGWWADHPQPVGLRRILQLAERDLDAAQRLIDSTDGPRHTDPRAAVADLSIPIRQSHLWRWPFAAGIEYLVQATIAGP